MFGRWDECCPHCEQKIKTLYEIFAGKDYGTSFDIECPHCGKPIEVYVHPVPEFELVKPEPKTATR